MVIRAWSGASTSVPGAGKVTITGNLTVNATNLEYGCRILQFYLQREDGHLHRALARYNGSVGKRVYSDKVYLAWNNHWRTEPLDWAN